MSELVKVILTSSLTVFGGVLIFVFGQIAVKFLIEPFHNYQILVGEIADSLVFYANVGTGLHDYYVAQLEEASSLEGYRKEIAEQRLKAIISNDWQCMDEAKRTLRQQASRLMGTANAIPFYWLWALFRLIPSRQNLIKASANLIGLSNSLGSSNSSGREKEIARHLQIKVLKKRFGD